jgi:hypothetical protein
MSTNIGSVSSGTMRHQDLIPSFLWEAKHQHLSRADRATLRKVASRVARIERGEFGDDDAYWTDETSDWDLESLFSILSNCAPVYFYFGAHPGDGSDYGYWLSEDFPQDFDGLKVSDLSEVPHAYTGEVLHVNDHGNMSLYSYSRGRARELWAIV